MDITIHYYEDKSRINNTAIGWFLFGGPSYFRKKMSGEIPDEESRAMSKGTMIHMWLLQPDEFKKHYRVSGMQKPKSQQQEKFCQELVNTTEIEPDLALLDAYKKVYSIVGKSEAKMLSEAKEIASTLSSYIEAIKDTKHIYISQNDMKMLESIRFNIDQHSAAKPLLDDPDAHHEFHINWDFPADDGRAPCKSLLDSVKFDTEKKECTIKMGEYTLNIATVNKMSAATTILEDVKKGKSKYHFIEIMNCLGGCIGGGGQPKIFPTKELEVKNKRINSLYERDSKDKIRVSYKNPDIIRVYDEFIGYPLSFKAKEMLHTR